MTTVDRKALQDRADEAWGVAHDVRRPHSQRVWARNYYRDVRRLLKALPPEKTTGVTITNLPHTPESAVRVVPVVVEGRLRA